MQRLLFSQKEKQKELQELPSEAKEAVQKSEEQPEKAVTIKTKRSQPSKVVVVTSAPGLLYLIYRDYLEPLFYAVYRFCEFAVTGVSHFVLRWYRFFRLKLNPKFKHRTHHFRHGALEFFEAFTKPFVKIRRGVYLIERNYYIAAEQHGRYGGVLYSFRTLAEGLANNKRLIRSVVNYVIPVIMVVIIGVLVSVTSNLTFAISVNYNSKEVGYIDQEAVFNQAENIMQGRITYESNQQPINITPDYTLALVNKNEIVGKNTLADNMIRLSNLDITEAKGLYVGDQFLGAVADTKKVQEALDGLLNKYRQDPANEKIEFAQTVEFKDGMYLATSMVDENKLISEVTGEKSGGKNYTVKAGDTPYDIAIANSIPLSALLSLNPGIDKNCYPGDVITISNSVPFLSVKVSRTETYQESVPYQVEEVTSNKYLKGTQMVTQKGINGTNQVTATIDYVDGAEVNRTVLKTDVVQQPVTQKVTLGSASPIINTSFSPAAGSGMFINPVPAAYVSQQYKGNRHKGIDLAAPYGSTIYAAAGGTVSLATWYSGYGKCVMIDHGNGIVSLYGHMSSILVSAGQVVAQGQPIGLVGATGQATGNHCHFEIRVNGGFVNPLSYLS